MAQSSSATDVLAQLKTTETQFRKASILAALEADQSQLFTFYKKVDVMKDQKSLLAKFGAILRNNSCIIAYKAATKTIDLLKPEHRKLYRLFVTAILASIDIVSHADSRVLALGQRYHVVDSKALGSVEEMTWPVPWVLVRTDLQVVQSGHVLLTLVTDISRTLFRVADVYLQWRSIPKLHQAKIPVILAPYGHLATYNGGWVGSWNSISKKPNELSPLEVERLKVWRRIFASWSKNDSNRPAIEDEDTTWVQLQIPRTLHSSSEDGEPEPTSFESVSGVEFQDIYWSADMCFVFKTPVQPQLPDRPLHEDPVRFVEDWFASAAMRFTESEHGDLEDTSHLDNGGLFDDELPFEHASAFQTFGPPVFPNSQTVYPTPPDVVMAHATPRMSSVDGMPMTPANGPRATGEAQNMYSRDAEMSGMDTTQAVAVGSGLYDEDLFEEMPDEDFGQSGASEEPNWDFFDKPALQKTRVEATSTEAREGPTPEEPDFGDSKTVSPAQGGQPVLPDSPKPEARAGSRPSDSPGKRQDAAAGGDSTAPQQDLAASHKSPEGRERRSSIYHISQGSDQFRQRDSKYKAKGSYWFGGIQQSTHAEPSPILPGWKRKTPSSSSASDSSMSDSDDWVEVDDAKTVLPRQWTIYEPKPPPEEAASNVYDTAAISREICSIFNYMNTKSTMIFLETNFQAPKRPNVGIPKDKPVLSLLFSQLVVDHYAQATLLIQAKSEKISEGGKGLGLNINPDLSNLNAPSTYASLRQLSTLGLTTAVGPGDTVITKIPERQIKFKRGDKDMVASRSILQFWDTLGLQPHTIPKDVTAFCLHPAGSGFEDGCANLMNRLADAYRDCNLGHHRTGLLSEITDSGLLSYSLDRDKKSSLMAVAMLLGDQLAKSTEMSGTVVVYIVGISAEPASYMQSCVAFYACFQAYKRAMNSRLENLELVLQVVPASFVSSTDTIVVPAQSAYNQLVLEVFARIPPMNQVASVGCYDYPVVLAHSGDNVHFNLESHGPSPFSGDGKSLHLAYSYSDDRRWLVACWSDEVGLQAHTMTYLIRSSSRDKGRPVIDLVKDMWEVSQDLMQKERARWRLIVARTGFYEIEELNSWSHLSNIETADFCSIQLIAVELEPTLQLSPSVMLGKGAQHQATSQINTYATPASTPQAITTSPEQMVPATPTPGGTSAINAATPPDHGFDANVDGDLALSDTTDESWMVVLPFATNQSHHILQLRPALTSGYLIKRAGVQEEDGFVTLGVHLVQTVGPKEGAVEEIIRQLHGLVTLAVARGCIDKVKQCVPWHIAVALKGARTLSGLM